jgi:hypothetical protein
MQILLLGVLSGPAGAQEGAQVRLAPIETEEFPQISSYLDIRTPEGGFVFGLESQDVHIIEDGIRLPVTDLALLHSGSQFVLAVSPGQAFDIRDVQGLTRYDYLSQALLDWASSRIGSTVDDLSIVLAGGPETTHISEIERWMAVLDSYTPTGLEVDPDFDVLARAIDIAADPTKNPGMGRVVLFITSLPEQDVSVGLQSLAARASQQGVRIIVWMVASSELFASPGAEQLLNLSELTGGTLFAYSGQEPIPSPEEYLEPLRSTYSIAYQSNITTSGPHQVNAEVNLSGQVFSSPAQEFDLEVLPPNVAFISPPMEIMRTHPEGDESDSQLLQPNSQPLELLIEYPDGYPRSIKETRLLVDGVVEQVLTAEPFERFTWDLSEYASEGEHILQAEVEDIIGLSAKTVETSVRVIIGNTSPGVLRIISQNKTMIAVLLVAISGAILLLVLVVGGRLRPGVFRELRRQNNKSDPVTQPVPLKQEQPSQPQSSWINRIHWPRRRVSTKAYAHLITLTDSNQEESSPPISITSSKVTFGRDPDQATHVLDDASVEALHTSLYREKEGTFRLADEGSTAGTWVNYTQVLDGGTYLEQGDLIHIGRVGFRFVLRDPKKVRKPVQKPEEPAQ